MDDIGYSVYLYTKYDEPISLKTKQKRQTLYLYRTDSQEDTTETFVFSKYKKSDRQIEGQWKSSEQQFQVKLYKDFEIDHGDQIEWESREILQRESLTNYYFKTINTKKKGKFYSYVSGVKIIEKSTDKILQIIDNLNCDNHSTWGVSIGDYNFDGYKDFAVFEQQYVGPNTSELYFLYKPETGNFVESGFEGIALDFDQQKKRIYERNSSQAGNSIITATYKVVKNEMVLVEETCIKWNEKKQKRTKRPIEACR